MTSLLTCGPYFRPGHAIASRIIVPGLKPIDYDAFVRAFRYRVNHDIPMTPGQALRLALWRLLVGMPLVLMGYTIESHPLIQRLISHLRRHGG